MTQRDAKLAARILSLLDLTSLNDDDSVATVEALCARAVTPAGPVAAICVMPSLVAAANATLDQRIGLATVINFPAGGEDRTAIIQETRAAVSAGADEIDMVFPYTAFLAGRRTLARDLVAAARSATPQGTILKVILETGRLGTATAIREAAEAAIGSGADFIKTSTGKLQPGATLEAAEIMLQVIHDLDPEVGFKAAGGIRTVAQASDYLALADRIMGPDWATPETFRIGASALLDDALSHLGAELLQPAGGSY